MEAIGARLAEAYLSNKGMSVQLVPLREELTGEVKQSLWVLFVAVGGLLLIACSNFAGLLLARSASRRAEITLRAAIGAGRGAILRQCFAESLLLALLGGIVGVIVAVGAIGVMTALAPPDLKRISEVSLDGRVLLYTLGWSVLTGLVFGLAPAITASRVSLGNALHTASRVTPRSARFRQGLVVAQVALTMVLLCASGLLVRSFRQLMHADLGLDPRDVLTLNIGLDGAPYDLRQEQYVNFYQQAFERLQSLPGVQSVAAGQNVPITGGVSGETRFHIQGTPEIALLERSSTSIHMVTPGYFKTLGIPIVRGRDFTAADRRGSPLVFTVNQAFVDDFLANSDPLSASMMIGSKNPYGRIVGVAGNVKAGSLRGHVQPTVFYTYSQISTSTDMFLFLKADNVLGLAQSAVQAIRDIDPMVPVYEVQLLEGVFGESVARDRLNAVVSSAFALSVLLLAAFGVYGVLSFQVAERTREIGIRIALGGCSSEVLRMVLGESLRLVIPGVVLGLAGALAFTQLFASLLYGIAPKDPFTFIGVIALIFGVGVVAAFLPARRATRVDPLIALRQE
jgi:putative ABC transport system permease protein